jgi:hypothetical protein
MNITIAITITAPPSANIAAALLAMSAERSCTALARGAAPAWDG